MSGTEGLDSRGAKDGDPIAIAILVFMVFMTLMWFSNSGISPAGGDVEVAGAFDQVFGQWQWFVYLIVPLAIMMFVQYMADEFSKGSESGSFLGPLKEEFRRAREDARRTPFRRLQKDEPREDDSGRTLSDEEIDEEIRKKKEEEGEE